jgi:hypothetical protein
MKWRIASPVISARDNSVRTNGSSVECESQIHWRFIVAEIPPSRMFVILSVLNEAFSLSFGKISLVSPLPSTMSFRGGSERGSKCSSESPTTFPLIVTVRSVAELVVMATGMVLPLVSLPK